MVEADSQREIVDFVREKAAWSSATQEGQDFYFQISMGRSPGNGKRAPNRGIYLSEHPDVDELAAVVLRFVGRNIKLMSDRPSAARVYLLFCQKGDNNPTDSIGIELIDDGTRLMGGGDAAEQIRRAGGSGTLDGGAAIALLETNNMLRGLLLHVFAELRSTLEAKTSSDGMVIELLAKLDTAERVLEVMKHETDVRKVDAMMDRIDPHIHEHGEKLVEVLAVLTRGWAWKWSGGAGDPCPAEPGPAADWLIERFEMAFWALGKHLETNPRVLNKRRKRKLEKLVNIMFDLAAALDDEDDDEPASPAGDVVDAEPA